MRALEVIYRIALLFNAFAVTCSSGLDDVPSYEELRKRLMSNIKSAERQVSDSLICGAEDFALDNLQRIIASAKAAVEKVRESKKWSVDPYRTELEELFAKVIQKAEEAHDQIAKKRARRGGLPTQATAIPLRRTDANRQHPGGEYGYSNGRQEPSAYDQGFHRRSNWQESNPLSSDSDSEDENYPVTDYWAKHGSYYGLDRQSGKMMERSPHYYEGGSQFGQTNRNSPYGLHDPRRRRNASIYDSDSFYNPGTAAWNSESRHGLSNDPYGHFDAWGRSRAERNYYGSVYSSEAEVWENYQWDDQPPFQPRRPVLTILACEHGNSGASGGEADDGVLCVGCVLRDIMALYDSLEKLFESREPNLEKLCGKSHDALLTPLSEKYAQLQGWLLTEFPKHAPVLVQLVERLYRKAELRINEFCAMITEPPHQSFGHRAQPRDVVIAPSSPYSDPDLNAPLWHRFGDCPPQFPRW